MSKNPNVEKAAQVLDENGFCGEDEAAEALDAAGLLVTPLHQRALEFCVETAKMVDALDASQPQRTGVYHTRMIDPHHAAAIGREALALEKPKAEEEPEPVIERIKRMWRSVRERNKIPGPLTDALDELIKQPGCAEKPKERWVAIHDVSGKWWFAYTDGPGRVCHKNLTEAQASAVAKALNEVPE